MTRYLSIILILLTACSPCRQIVEQRDSVTHTTTQRDSVTHTTTQRDSVSQRDSVFVFRAGDTLYIYKERQVVKWRDRGDTVYRDKLITDTLYRERVQTISTPTADPVKWYDKGFIWFGRLCLIALLLWLIFLYIKRKV